LLVEVVAELDMVAAVQLVDLENQNVRLHQVVGQLLQEQLVYLYL
tara:strand:+ start:38 stop:172 length:135 start_codon:yes stop_codon:yes gene_type:complete